MRRIAGEPSSKGEWEVMRRTQVIWMLFITSLDSCRKLKSCILSASWAMEKWQEVGREWLLIFKSPGFYFVVLYFCVLYAFTPGNRPHETCPPLLVKSTPIAVTLFKRPDPGEWITVGSDTVFVKDPGVSGRLNRSQKLSLF